MQSPKIDHNRFSIMCKNHYLSQVLVHSQGLDFFFICVRIRTIYNNMFHMGIWGYGARFGPPSYIYIYIYREREIYIYRERECIYIYIYIYIFVFHRERGVFEIAILFLLQ